MAEVSINERVFSYPEFRPIGSESLSVFDFQDVLTDLMMLRQDAELPADPVSLDDVSGDEWRDIVMPLVESLGPSPESESFEEWSSGADTRSRHAIASRLGRVEKALKHAYSATESGVHATGVLLPTSFARRVEVLLSRAILPLAWVRRVDILRF